MARVRRYDTGTLRAPTRTADGRLRVDGRLSRTGVYVYRNADGTERREYRPAEEVFAKEALDSFAMVPVTDDHPSSGLITAKNTKKYAVGWLGETVKADGNFVAAPLVIADAETIAKVEHGKQQLSCGYTCDYDPTPGMTPEGEKYDGVQRNIRGNHVAIVDVGRAGPGARLRMDADAAFQVDDLTAAARGNLTDAKFAVPERSLLPIEDESHVKAAMARFGQTHFESAEEKKTAFGRIVRRAKDLGIDPAGFVQAWQGRLDEQTFHVAFTPGLTGEELAKKVATALRSDAAPTKESNVKITINGVEFEVTEQVGQAFAKFKADADDAVKAAGEKAKAELATVTAERDGLKGRADQAEADLAKERKLRTDGESTFAARVNARVALEAKARKIVGNEAKFDGKTDREVQVDTLVKLMPEFKADGQPDGYIAGRFDAAVERATDGTHIVPVENLDGAGVDAEKKARAAMIANNQNAWKTKEGK